MVLEQSEQLWCDSRRQSSNLLLIKLRKRRDGLNWQGYALKGGSIKEGKEWLEDLAYLCFILLKFFFFEFPSVFDETPGAYEFDGDVC